MRVIYKYTNLVNGKIYIGQTSDFQNRMIGHRNGKSLLSKALKCYGEENFTKEILCRCESPEEANNKEKYYIEFFNSLTPNGYNIQNGGVYTRKGDEIKMAMCSQGQKNNNKSPNSSVFVGVRKGSGGKGFQCAVRIKKKIKTKTFPTEELAAEAYDKMVLFLYGKLAKLNFPDKRDDYLSQNLDEFFNNFLKPLIPKTSKYYNIGWHYDCGGKWIIKISRLSKFAPPYRFGMFKDEEVAARLADKIVFFFNLPPRYNFPDEVSKYNRADLKLFFDSLPLPSSVYLGVYLRKTTSLWACWFLVNGKKFTLSGFKTEEEAHSARENAIRMNQPNRISE